MAGLNVRAAGLWNRTVGTGTAVAVVVSVTRPDGSAVTGLTDNDFDLYVVDNPSVSTTHVIGSPGSSEFTSPPDGLYVMGTGQPPGGAWGSDELAILVQVTAGGDKGRALLNVVLG